MAGMELLERVEAHIRRHDLIPPGGEVCCLVSGGPDSTFLWHALRELGYAVSAVHVNHGLRGDESEEDAEFCRERFGVAVLQPSDKSSQGTTEASLRDFRYAVTAPHGLRATGHTRSDQAETVLYRLVSSGSTRGIKLRREDGVVRPLLGIWREEARAWLDERALPYRHDSSNPDTLRGLIRAEILPRLRELHPAAEENLARLADEPPRLPHGMAETLTDLLSSTAGTKHADLGRGIRATREYDVVSLDAGPVRFGPWLIEATEPGLAVRTRRPGDRLAGRRRKLQDVFVDAKVPRAERDVWPVVVRGDEVVAVPGIVEDDAVRTTRPSSRSSGVAGKGGKPAARRTVHPSTDKRRGRSILPPAAPGGGGAGLRPAGADAGEGRE
jgi:tRNA(Ile)-lysidine synthetase-like protein